MDSIRVSEAPDPSSILGIATNKIPHFYRDISIFRLTLSYLTSCISTKR